MGGLIIPKSWIQRLGPGSQLAEILRFCAAFVVRASPAHLLSMAAAMVTWCATHADLQKLKVKVFHAVTVEKRRSTAASLLLSLCSLLSCKEADPVLIRNLAAPHFLVLAPGLAMH